MNFNEAIKIADRIYWVGMYLENDPFQCHPYLIENGDASVLVDPGSVIEFDAVVAKSKSGTQPLCGVYKRSVLSIAKEHLTEGNHRLNSLLKKVDTQLVPFEDDELFLNLNHPHEYEKAKKSLT